MKEGKHTCSFCLQRISFGRYGSSGVSKAALKMCFSMRSVHWIGDDGCAMSVMWWNAGHFDETVFDDKFVN